jgi:hypothetical protein
MNGRHLADWWLGRIGAERTCSTKEGICDALQA